MFRRHNLREALGLCGAGGVTAGAYYGGVRFYRNDRGWVVRMAKDWRIGRERLAYQGNEALVQVGLGLLGNGQALKKRVMTGLAVDVGMLAGLLFVSHVGVTGLTRVMPGELCRVSGNLAHRSSAVVPILPKAFGDNVVARHQKYQESEDKQPRKPEKMSCFLENAHEGKSP
jgi:hypothetical protein